MKSNTKRIVVYGLLALIGFWLLRAAFFPYMPFPFFFAPNLAFIFWLLLFAVHMLFASGTMRDAEARLAAGETLFFVSPRAWALAVVASGLAGVALYWVFHHSTLRR